MLPLQQQGPRWAWHQWVGPECGHGQQLSLECGARDPLRGTPVPPELPEPCGVGHPGTGLSPTCCLSGPRDTLGCGCSQLPHHCAQSQEQGGELPPGQSSVVGQEAASASPLSLTRSSKPPVPPSVSLLVAKGEDPTPVPHSAAPAAPRSITSHPPQGRASGCQVAPEIWGQTSRNLGPNLAQALRQGGGVRGSWGTPGWGPSLLGVRRC